MIRPLEPAADGEAVLDLLRRCAGYIDLESGREPSPALVADYFSDAAPGGGPATSLKVGLFENGRLIGIADLAFGYPEPSDAYLGLMILAQEARGQGQDRRFLRHLEDAARVRGARRLLLAVLDAHPGGGPSGRGMASAPPRSIRLPRSASGPMCGSGLRRTYAA